MPARDVTTADVVARSQANLDHQARDGIAGAAAVGEGVKLRHRNGASGATKPCAVGREP